MGGERPQARIVEDPSDEVRQLRARLAEETRRRETAEAELEALKKGSVAMMKYVSNLQRKKHDEELEFMKQEVAELRVGTSDARREAQEASRRSAEAAAASGGHKSEKGARLFRGRKRP